MDKLTENLPQIISAAAQSQLGILALLSVALSVLAYFFFAAASEKVKVGIFVLLFLGVVSFGAAMFRATTDVGPTPAPEPKPQPTPTPTPEPVPVPVSQVEAHCVSLYHKSTNSEPSDWKGSVKASCSPGTQMIACEYWRGTAANGINDIASGPTPVGNGCGCECQHAAKEGFMHSGKGHWCGCYPVAVCASEPVNLSGPKAEVVKAAIAASPSCR